MIQEYTTVPFIFLTGLPEETYIERARKTRPRGIITKPFKAAEPAAIIEKALQQERSVNPLAKA
jgi:DNA-binding NarL/FixJ family response regulator